MISPKNEESSSKNNGNGNGKPKNPNARKFLFVSFESLSGDLAWQLKKEGHEVKVFIEKETDQDVYDGFLEKVPDWKSLTDWADVIVFDDIGFGDYADSLRQKGKLVIGGSRYTDKLEEDREFGQEEMKKAGMLVLPHWDFMDFDSAIQFIRENPGRYVFKPSGNTPSDSKGILFLGQEDDGKDLIEILEQNKKTWARKIKKFQLQKMAVGVEVAVGAFFNGEDFIYPINVNFEHKKLFPGDIGPYTGEMGCYDDKTEVLTEEGWKFFKDVLSEDKICTLNPKNESIEYHKPQLLVSFDHHKELITVENQTMDLAVTLDHNMYLNSQTDARKGINNFKFVKAKDMECQSVIKRTGNWIGFEEKYFVLPSVSLGHYEGNQVLTHQSPEIKILMDDWLAFMGIWIAEGSISNSCIQIAQKKPEKNILIEELLKKLPFKFKRNDKKSCFYVYGKQLASYLEQFGKAYNKFVPGFIKNLSSKQIEIFLKWYGFGDGTMMKEGFRIFYTSSKKLADDTQELLLKIGRVGIIKERKRRGEGIWIKDHFANCSRTQYEILERVKKLDSWIDKRDIKKIKYEGTVYCAEVTNHVMFVRRNGKPYWCGNTTVFWCPPNELFRHTLFKIRDELAKSGYVGYIDINCIANSKGIYPLEFTSRFGYPIISIHMEGILSEWGDFLYRIAGKEEPELKTKKGFQIGVCVVVLPFPFDDRKESFIYKDLSILFRKPNLEGVHLGDVKRINDVWVIAGDSGYVLVITGSGLTMEEARKQCYMRVKNIILQNMYYRTDIGLRWLLGDSDKLMTWGYLY
jgi:phosphoribosylamine-glycine ligase